MRIRFSFFAALLAFGPCRPAKGTAGPMGPQGETGPPREGIFIERQLSSSLYDEENNILIEDDRITPTTLPNPFILRYHSPELFLVAYSPLIFLYDYSYIRVARGRGFSPNQRR